MTNFVNRLSRVLSYYQGERQRLLDQVAYLQGQLAAALANDAADAEAIAAAEEAAADARSTAEAATAEAERLQALVDADVAEDAAIEAALSEVEAQLPVES